LTLELPYYDNVFAVTQRFCQKTYERNEYILIESQEGGTAGWV